MKKYSLEDGFNNYLKQINMAKEQMSIVQHNEMKKAFVAGVTDLLVVFTRDVADMDEEVGAAYIEELILTTDKFWKEAT